MDDGNPSVSGPAWLHPLDQLLGAASAGLGIALLPDRVCRAELNAGRLVRVLPEWHAQIRIVHLVFTTRRGLPPAVRAQIDHVAKYFPPAIATGEQGSTSAMTGAARSSPQQPF